MAGERKHKTFISAAIESESPVELHLVEKGATWWFKMLHCWVETGWWSVMSGACAKVLVVLAKHANADWEAWPKVPRIMRLSGLEKTAVFGALSDLQKYGLIIKLDRGYGEHRDTKWKLTVPRTIPNKFRPRGQSSTKSGMADNHADRPGGRITHSDSAESIPHIRNRSISEQELEHGIAPPETETDPLDWAQTLSDEEAAKFTEAARDDLTPAQRAIIKPHKTVKNCRPLAQKAYELAH